MRSFKRYEGAKQGLFTQEQIAQAIPDFRGATKQSVQDHERRFRESGRDVQGYLNRKRKVDEQVVRVLQEELLANPLEGGVVSYQEANLLEQSFSALEESESVGKGDALEAEDGSWVFEASPMRGIIEDEIDIVIAAVQAYLQ